MKETHFIVYPPNGLDYQEGKPPDRSGMKAEARAWAESLGWRDSEEDEMWMTSFYDVGEDGEEVTVCYRFTCPPEIRTKAGQDAPSA